MALTIPISALAQFGAVGISAVGGQRFGNEELPPFFPASEDLFGAVLATGDLYGDGADDLVISLPGHGNANGETPESGIVLVRRGVAGSGLISGPVDLLLSQVASGAPDPAEEGDRFGSSLAACDLDADGFDDLVVGVPEEGIGSSARAGAVQIHFGSELGPAWVADLFLTQDSPGIPGGVGFAHLFGGALACADFDGDGFADLAVGVPLDSPGVAFAGSLVIVPGSARPIDLAASYPWNQNLAGMEDEAEQFEAFARTLAAGDFDGDGFADLAIGVPGESSASGEPCGAVHIVRGSAAGLVVAGNRLFRETDFGAVCAAPGGFGDALATGDFDGDGRDDLLVGLPTKSFGGTAIFEGGQAIAVYGSAVGLDSPGAQLWVENGIFGPGATENNDRFGFALATGDFDGDGYDDAAFGHPGEFQLVAADGAVTLLAGSADGLSAARRHGLGAGLRGFPGVANQSNRGYGFALGTGDFDRDGFADLAIGAPEEDEGGLAEVGAVVALYGSLFADGFESQDADFWTASVPGVP